MQWKMAHVSLCKNIFAFTFGHYLNTFVLFTKINHLCRLDKTPLFGYFCNSAVSCPVLWCLKPPSLGHHDPSLSLHLTIILTQVVSHGLMHRKEGEKKQKQKNNPQSKKMFGKCFLPDMQRYVITSLEIRDLEHKTCEWWKFIYADGS